jgi:predicted dehydrogenase
VKQLRVAVVGAGYQGRFHARAYAALEWAALVGVCDLDASRAESVAAGCGADAAYGDYLQLLREQEPDLLSICTMPASHREIAVAAAQAGAHVLCEKPLAMSHADGVAMFEAAERAGRFLTVAYNMRWMGSSRYLHSLVGDGAAGAPLYCRTWLHETQIPWWGRHYVRDVNGGGVMTASAGHVVDVALWVAGFRRPVSVSASAATQFPRKRGSTAPSAEAASRYDVEDLVAAHVRFEDGFFMTIEAGWGWDRLEESHSFELVCEHATLSLDPLRVVADREGVPVDVTPAGEQDADWDASVERGVHAVARAALEGEAPLVSREQALTVQAINDAVYASAAAGKETAAAIL